MNSKRIARYCGYGTALLLLYIWLVISTAFGQSLRTLASTSSFDIPPQPLPTALLRYTEQSGVHVTSSANLVEDKQSLGVVGKLNSRAALSKILEGTSLAFDIIDDNSVVIMPARATLNPRPGEKRPVSASNAASVQDDNEVVVTGSHIRMSNNASQVYSFDRAAINATGVSSLQQFMRLVPQNLTGGRSEASSALRSYRNSGQDNIGDGAGVNLRGLGNEATLVLVGGHRMSAAGFGSFHDLSTLPLNAVERIDVLPDGMSAIYGSDAIGGVVNVVLRESVDGAESQLRYGGATDGSLHEWSIGQVIGTTWQSGSLMLAGDFRQQDSLHATDREHAVDLWSGRNDLLPEERRLSSLLRAQQELSRSVDVALDVYASKRGSESWQYHRGVGAQLIGDAETELLGGTATLAWAPAKGWNIDLTHTYSQTESSRDTVGYRGSQTVRSGIAVEIGLSTTELKAHGPAFYLPSGGLAELAIGAERRHERMGLKRFGSTRAAPTAANHRTVDAAYAELQLPLMSRTDDDLTTVLGLNAALRYDDFSDVGATDNIQIGATWSPLMILDLRATWGTSFRAPYLYQFDESFNTGVVMYVPNPASTSGRTLTAIATQGPHPNLGPETATTWTAGFTIGHGLPANIRISGTYFNIDYRDRIVAPSISATPFSDSQQLTYISMPPDPEVLEWVRSAPLFSNLTPNSLADVEATLDGRANSQSYAQVSGFDFVATSDIQTSIGTIAAALNANYFTRFDTRATKSVAAKNILNTLYNPVDFRGRGQLTWSLADWSVLAAINYVDEYKDDQRLQLRRISSWTTIDVGAIYSFAHTSGWLRDLTLRANIINAMNKAPPRVYDLQGAYGDPGYDSASANTLGRFISVEISKLW